ncbi:MAG: hypothetical protein KC636_21560, partial [Myxococcales bacterium]|nr:hypothetical protein [Myxococcales bacterium]
DAYQTVGSAMAVRADVYRRQGGMNRRKAGEDFYFLQKVIPLGGFTELRATTVYPSPRVSHRVPFGTGRAMGAWIAGADDEPTTYDPRVYEELRALIFRLGNLDGAPRALLAQAPESLRPFLASQGFESAIREIQANAATPQSRRRRFFHWMNAFRVLKLVHDATAARYPRVPVSQAAATVAQARGFGEMSPVNAEGCLARFRAVDRGEIAPAACQPSHGAGSVGVF